MTDSSIGKYAWYVVLLLTLLNVVNYMDRMALSVLAPLIVRDLQLSDAQLGLLIGFAFSVFYAVCGLPIARWADVGIRRNIISLSVAIWSCMTALCGTAQNFSHLFIARVGVGVGEAGANPASQSMLCDYVPLRRRPGVFALHSFGMIAGLMVGMALAGYLGETIGWRWTFAALGLPGVVLAALVRLTLREPIRGALDGPKSDGAVSLREALTMLIRCKTYRLLLLVIVATGFVHYALNLWWPMYYSRTFGMPLSSVGIYLGIAIGIGSGIGSLIGGLMGNKVAPRDVRMPLIIGSACTSLSVVTVAGSLLAPAPAISLVLVSLTGLLWSISNGPILAALTSVVDTRVRATASAFSTFFTSIFGFGLGPFCVGFLSDLLAPTFGRDSLRFALFAPLLLIPVIVFTLYAAAQALRNDLRKQGVETEDDGVTPSRSPAPALLISAAATHSVRTPQ